MQCILSLVFFLSSLFYLVTSISKENVNVFTQLVTELEDKESELQMTTKLTRIIKESNEINNQEPYPDEVIYETESEEVSSQSASAPYNMSTEKYERIINQLAKYRSFAINEIKVFLDDIDTYESSSKDNEIIRVYYKDDLQLECNIPESKFRGSYDWSINGYYLRLNESSYSLILDKKIDKNLTHLNFSCYFESTEAGQIVSLQFPTLVIGMKVCYLKFNILAFSLIQIFFR